MAVARVFEDEWSPVRDELVRLRVVRAPTAQRFMTGVPVSLRRAARERMMRRRRRAVLVFGIVASVVILAWPGHAFGGVTSSGANADANLNSTLTAGMVYVVQPGDTISSIARVVNSTNVNHVKSELIKELRSSVVLAGEHVLIP